MVILQLDIKVKKKEVLACFPKSAGINKCAKKRDPDSTKPLGLALQPTNHVLSFVFFVSD